MQPGFLGCPGGAAVLSAGSGALSPGGIRWAGGAAGCCCGRVDQGLLGLHGVGASYPGVGVGVRLDVGVTWWCVAVVLRICAAWVRPMICARGAVIQLCCLSVADSSLTVVLGLLVGAGVCSCAVLFAHRAVYFPHLGMWDLVASALMYKSTRRPPAGGSFSFSPFFPAVFAVPVSWYKSRSFPFETLWVQV